MVEKRWLSDFIVTCALCLAVGLGFFQLRVHSLPLFLTNRTIARRSSIGRLRLCRVGLTF